MHFHKKLRAFRHAYSGAAGIRVEGFGLWFFRKYQGRKQRKGSNSGGPSSTFVWGHLGRAPASSSGLGFRALILVLKHHTPNKKNHMDKNMENELNMWFIAIIM